MIQPMPILLTMVSVVSVTAAQSPLNALRSLKVTASGPSTQITVEGSKPPTFTVFRLHEPERLVVDVSAADAAGIKGHYDGQANVAGILASQFTDGRSNVGRVLVSLKNSAPYDVRADGNRVLIEVQGPPAPEAKSEVEAAAPAAAVPAAEVAPPPSDVVKVSVDEKPVKVAAQRLKQLTLDTGGLRVLADAELARFDVIELKAPPRLALDFFGVKSEARVPTPRGAIRQVRMGPHSDKVRLVLEWGDRLPTYQVRRTSRGLQLRWEEPGGASSLASSAEAPSFMEIDGRPVTLAAVPEGKTDEVEIDIRDMTFDENAQGGHIVLKLSGTPRWKVDRPNASSAVLTLEGARLPKKLERSLDTTELKTPIKMISAFSVPGKGVKTRVVVTGEGALTDTMTALPNGLSWRFRAQAVQVEQVSASNKTAADATEDPTSPKSAPVAPIASARGKFRGKAVSFEFKDIEIHNLMRMIAEVSKKNIVVADDVTGKVTIRLRNVPWDQALELILRSKGLGQEDLGNIIRVAPLRTLEEEAKLREERKKSIQRQEELSVQLIAVNYASANDLSSRVKEILSERGSVTVDARTNTLIIRDILSSIGKAKSLVKSLDTQTPQVLIESRIVEANTNFSRQVGIQWGGNAQMAQSTGNSTGLVFPNTVVARGGAPAESADGVAAPPNFAVNLPAAVGTGAGGALGFVFGSAGGAVALNLRLSALENQGAVKTISAPKVTTLDNSPARISQGVSIPFSQTSAGGVNTTFVEARLSLEVTPHITADGSILMTIRAENNQPDPANTGANGQPSIQRKEANTQVLVKDGDTTVIGGIYVRRGSTATRSVPFLSKIPILGFFFKNVTESDTRQELLIFITPRIINQQVTAQNL